MPTGNRNRPSYALTGRTGPNAVATKKATEILETKKNSLGRTKSGTYITKNPLRTLRDKWEKLEQDHETWKGKTTNPHTSSSSRYLHKGGLKKARKKLEKFNADIAELAVLEFRSGALKATDEFNAPQFDPNGNSDAHAAAAQAYFAAVEAQERRADLASGLYIKSYAQRTLDEYDKLSNDAAAKVTKIHEGATAQHVAVDKRSGTEIAKVQAGLATKRTEVRTSLNAKRQEITQQADVNKAQVNSSKNSKQARARAAYYTTEARIQATAQADIAADSLTTANANLKITRKAKADIATIRAAAEVEYNASKASKAPKSDRVAINTKFRTRRAEIKATSTAEIAQNEAAHQAKIQQSELDATQQVQAAGAALRQKLTRIGQQADLQLQQIKQTRDKDIAESEAAHDEHLANLEEEAATEEARIDENAQAKHAKIEATKGEKLSAVYAAPAEARARLLDYLVNYRGYEPTAPGLTSQARADAEDAIIAEYRNTDPSQYEAAIHKASPAAKLGKLHKAFYSAVERHQKSSATHGRLVTAAGPQSTPQDITDIENAKAAMDQDEKDCQSKLTVLNVYADTLKPAEHRAIDPRESLGDQTLTRRENLQTYFRENSFDPTEVGGNAGQPSNAARRSEMLEAWNTARMSRQNSKPAARARVVAYKQKAGHRLGEVQGLEGPLRSAVKGYQANGLGILGEECLLRWATARGEGIIANETNVPDFIYSDKRGDIGLALQGWDNHVTNNPNMSDDEKARLADEFTRYHIDSDNIHRAKNDAELAKLPDPVLSNNLRAVLEKVRATELLSQKKGLQGGDNFAIRFHQGVENKTSPLGVEEETSRLPSLSVDQMAGTVPGNS